MFAVLLWVGEQGVFGMALLAIVAPWSSHYAEAVYQGTVQGRATPPLFGGGMVYLGRLRSMLRAGLSIAAALGVWALAMRHGCGALVALFVTIYVVSVLCYVMVFRAF